MVFGICEKVGFLVCRLVYFVGEYQVLFVVLYCFCFVQVIQVVDWFCVIVSYGGGLKVAFRVYCVVIEMGGLYVGFGR